MNIHEQHVAELCEAQEAFNRGIAKVHEFYAADVQRSRDKLFAALNGESPRPAVDVAQIEQAIEAPYDEPPTAGPLPFAPIDHDEFSSVHPQAVA